MVDAEPTIINARDFAGGLEACARFWHAAWGAKDNFPFFDDTFRHSSPNPTATPRFYVLVVEKQVVGCYGLVTMDFVSRQDLYPWFAGLFVLERFRRRGYARLLLLHAAEEARRMGLSALYLTTDLHGFYERCGWERIEDGYDRRGQPERIYRLRIE